MCGFRSASTAKNQIYAEKDKRNIQAYFFRGWRDDIMTIIKAIAPISAELQKFAWDLTKAFVTEVEQEGTWVTTGRAVCCPSCTLGELVRTDVGNQGSTSERRANPADLEDVVLAMNLLQGPCSVSVTETQSRAEVLNSKLLKSPVLFFSVAWKPVAWHEGTQAHFRAGGSQAQCSLFTQTPGDTSQHGRASSDLRLHVVLRSSHNWVRVTAKHQGQAAVLYKSVSSGLIFHRTRFLCCSHRLPGHPVWGQAIGSSPQLLRLLSGLWNSKQLCYSAEEMLCGCWKLTPCWVKHRLWSGFWGVLPVDLFYIERNIWHP